MTEENKQLNQPTPPEQPQPAVKPEQDVYFKSNLAGREEPYTEKEVKERQANWQRFEEQPDSYKRNLFPDYFYAGFWIRLWAFWVDSLCIAGITNLTLNLGFRLTNHGTDGGFLSLYALASLVIYLGYFTLLTKLNHGQTIGKMIFGIRVVSLTEEELSWSTVIMRETVCRFILKTPPFMLGYLPAAFSSKKQHLGDYFADTSVVTINLIKAFNKEIQV